MSLQTWPSRKSATAVAKIQRANARKKSRNIKALGHIAGSAALLPPRYTENDSKLNPQLRPTCIPNDGPEFVSRAMSMWVEHGDARRRRTVADKAGQSS